jgi:hypothetical protein
MTRIARGLVALLVAASPAGVARAEPVSPEIGAAAAPFEPSFYLAGMVATTMAYRPSGGEVAGPQSDLTPMAGVGILVRPDLALELDAGPTMVDGEYVAFALESAQAALARADACLYQAKTSGRNRVV